MKRFRPRLLWMTPRRFAWTLRARGPGIAEWPATERYAATKLLRTNAAARDLLAEALANEDAPAADPAALARITCPVHRALAPLTPFMRGIRWGALAACVAAGLYLGLQPGEADTLADLLPSLVSSTPATVLAALDR